MSCLGRIQLEPFVGLLNMVVGMMTYLSLSVVLMGDSLKLMKFGFSERTVSLPKFIWPHAYTSELSSVTTLLPIILLQPGVGSLCLAGNRLIEASSGLAFLAYCRMMDRLGTSIFWLHLVIEYAEGPIPVRTWVVVLGGILTVFLSTGFSPLAFFQFITGGSLRTPTVLHIALMMISLCRTLRTACKSPLLVVNPSVVVWLTRGMMPWMIAEISLFVNNLCGEFMLVV